MLNLGILAHVDAGKTSLTERLLYAAGVIDEIGSVDDGSTQTDTLALERQRGITIKSAVVSFQVKDTTVNLIDTPGHPDFIAEVERVLSVLDGVVLVISAVAGVQAQTHVLMRALRRLRIPTLIFVNKIDRGGAGTGRATLLPAAKAEQDGPPAGAVFKVDRGPAGEKIAYVRIFDGTLRVRDRLPQGKVTAITTQDKPATQLTAGQIGKLWGLGGIQVGDTIGQAGRKAAHQFAPPTLETVVIPASHRDRVALHTALTQLAEQDPLINLRQDGGEILLSLYGEVQKQVIQATLADEFGVIVGFRESTVLCVERPAGIGTAARQMKAEGNPFLATIGLRVEPGRPGAGTGFRLEIELGALPLAFIKAIEDTVHATLRRGPRGWRVIDCDVILTESGYAPRQSHAHARFDKSMSSTGADFRGLTPIVLMAALERAGTVVLEPVQRFRLALPAAAVPATLPALTRLGGIPQAQLVTGAAATVEGLIPAAQVSALERLLPGQTSGEGVLETVFSHYS